MTEHRTVAAAPIETTFEFVNEPSVIHYTTDGSQADGAVGGVGLHRPARAGRGVPHRRDDDVPVARGGHQGQRRLRQADVPDQRPRLSDATSGPPRRAARRSPPRRDAAPVLALAVAVPARRSSAPSRSSRRRRAAARGSAPARAGARARPARVPPPRRRPRARVLHARVPRGWCAAATTRARPSRRSPTAPGRRAPSLMADCHGIMHTVGRTYATRGGPDARAR